MRTVQCARLKKEAPGFDVPPVAGRIGQLIYEKVSVEAFDAWKDIQTKIINEYRLDLSEAQDREVLFEQMRNFLGLSDKGASDVLHVGTPDHERHDHGHGGDCC